MPVVVGYLSLVSNETGLNRYTRDFVKTVPFRGSGSGSTRLGQNTVVERVRQYSTYVEKVPTRDNTEVAESSSSSWASTMLDLRSQHNQFDLRSILYNIIYIVYT